MSEPDWWRYLPKHCARYHTWKPACTEFTQKSKPRLIKYFTLCGDSAVDVFMFERLGILSRNAVGRIQNIVICEEDENKLDDIEKYVKPPTPVINCELGKVLTFQDSPETEHIQPLDKRKLTLEERKIERIKRFQPILMDLFPFDIINFDPCRSLLNTESEDTKNLLPGLMKIFEIQRELGKNQFILILTIPLGNGSPLGSVSPSVESEFQSDFKNNIDNQSGIKVAIGNKFATINYDEIDEMARISLSIAKTIILKHTKDYWNCEHKGIDIYENNRGNKYLSSVILFIRKDNGLFDDTNYIEEIKRVILEYPAFYSYERSSNDEVVDGDLKAIKEFAESIWSEFD